MTPTFGGGTHLYAEGTFYEWWDASLDEHPAMQPVLGVVESPAIGGTTTVSPTGISDTAFGTSLFVRFSNPGIYASPIDTTLGAVLSHGARVTF